MKKLKWKDSVGLPILWITLMSGVLLLMTVPGCADLKEAATTTVEQLQPVVDGSRAVVSLLEEQIKTLPPGDPLRVALEQKLVKTREVLDTAAKQIAVANAVLASIDKGEVTPGLQAALSTVPYGVYISLALSIGAAVIKSGQAGKFKDATVKIVQAWQNVGPELTPEEKAAAAAIQGPKVTALVHEIKAKL